MDDTNPHMALLALHHLVDEAIRPLFDELHLESVTETIMTVDRHELEALGDGEDPLSVLLSLNTPDEDYPAVLIAEPMLCNTILGKIWRTNRATHTPLTQVERTMLQQTLNDLCKRWRFAWQQAHINTLPEVTLVSSLSLVQPQLNPGIWFVARTVILDGEEAVGVLLFCYPEVAVPALTQARAATTWRQRIRRTLDPHEKMQLDERLSRLRDVKIPAPVKFRLDMPLRAINQLERGDVLVFDAPINGEIALEILDKPVTARLARHQDKLALAVIGQEPVYAEMPPAAEMYDPNLESNLEESPFEGIS